MRRVDQLSDGELVEAWRDSTAALRGRSAPERVLIVVLWREALLDELERRRLRVP